MITNKFIKSLLLNLAFVGLLLGFSVENSNAYPVFAQQNYSNPRAANGKLACANCHLNQKAIEIEAPQAVLPNSVFEITVKVPYDTTQKQIGANGQKADLNVGGILILPFSIPELNNVQWEQIPSNIWTSIFFLIAGATFLTYLLNGWALRHANSSLVGAYIYLQPILASVIAILLGKDQLTTHKVIFGLMIFVGVYLVSVPSALPLSRFKK